MPINVPNDLPAISQLEKENIFVMGEERSTHQDIRPLDILLVNLMPTKVETEIQLMRLLSNTPLQVNVRLVQMKTHVSKSVSQEYLDQFYDLFDEVKCRNWDGMIITGAPVEKLEFEDVDYWPELCEIMKWTRTNVHCTLHICWGAQAGLFYHYGIGKYDLPEKLSGVYRHTAVRKQSPFFRGFDDEFYIPHSRYTGVREEDILACPELELLATSEKAGVFAVKSENNRRFFILGHPEYDADTLKLEYERDVAKGIAPNVPENYFPGDDPTQPPLVRWRAHAQLLYSNWLNYYVYQTTPYDLEKIE